MDVEQLHADIRDAQPSDPIASLHLNSISDPRWTTHDGLLYHDNRIWVPDSGLLQVRVLQYKRGVTVPLLQCTLPWQGGTLH